MNDLDYKIVKNEIMTQLTTIHNNITNRTYKAWLKRAVKFIYEEVK